MPPEIPAGRTHTIDEIDTMVLEPFDEKVTVLAVLGLAVFKTAIPEVDVVAVIVCDRLRGCRDGGSKT